MNTVAAASSATMLAAAKGGQGIFEAAWPQAEDELLLDEVEAVEAVASLARVSSSFVLPFHCYFTAFSSQEEVAESLGRGVLDRDRGLADLKTS